jgi:SAM-dependent methyltransferase
MAITLRLHAGSVSNRGERAGGEERVQGRRGLSMARLDQPELLDLGRGSQADVAASLAELERINTYLGGYRSLARELFPRLAAAAPPVSLADIGTGAGGLPRLIARWGRRHGVAVKILAFDQAPRHLIVAEADTCGYPEILLVQADADALPLPPEGVDYAISSLVLHHFAPEALVTLLRAAYARSRRGLVMSDLIRGWLPYLGFKLAQPVIARNFLTRYDGAVSIRRAYTPAELLDLAHAAGLAQARVYTHLPWRMTLVVDR